MAALYHSTTPIYTVILRRAFGVAGGVFADPNDGAGDRVSWSVEFLSSDCFRLCSYTCTYFLHFETGHQAIGVVCP
jgi:hypothetical protein